MDRRYPGQPEVNIRTGIERDAFTMTLIQMG
jgi:hypothetical protein